jgi:hypothetical protein
MTQSDIVLCVLQLNQSRMEGNFKCSKSASTKRGCQRRHIYVSFALLGDPQAASNEMEAE